MSRSALVLSLALHTGLMAFVGLGLSTTAAHRADPGEPGVGVSFISDSAAGLLLVDTSPEELPSDSDVSLEQSPTVPPPPTVEAAIAPQPTTVAQIPAPAPPAVVSGMVSANTPSTPPKKAKPVANKGSGTKGSGAMAGSGSASAGSGSGGGGLGYIPPHFLMRYKPPYPQAARAQKLEGTVTLLASIDEHGRVISVSLQHTSGSSVLDRTALEAVRSWRFVPATQFGVPVAANQVVVPVRFQFQG